MAGTSIFQHGTALSLARYLEWKREGCAHITQTFGWWHLGLRFNKTYTPR